MNVHNAGELFGTLSLIKRYFSKLTLDFDGETGLLLVILALRRSAMPTPNGLIAAIYTYKIYRFSCGAPRYYLGFATSPERQRAQNVYNLCISIV